MAKKKYSPGPPLVSFVRAGVGTGEGEAPLLHMPLLLPHRRGSIEEPSTDELLLSLPPATSESNEHVDKLNSILIKYTIDRSISR